jgi:hypothetical protein
MNIETNSTKIPASAGAATFSQKYDSFIREGELSQRHNFSSQVFLATILEVNQQLQCYRIRAGGLPDMIATTIQSFGKTSDGAFSSVSSSLYGVGTKVLAIMTPAFGVNQAIILGALATHFGTLVAGGSPELVASSPVGSSRDDISSLGLMNCCFNNFNDRRPIDAYPGDTTILNTLGCGLFVGALQTSLISGADCSVELHYVDALLRINSYNFEQNTAGSEVLSYCDAGDYTEIKRINPYVVESLGASGEYSPVPKTKATVKSKSQDRGEITGRYKPELETQLGWFRYSEFSGYLANLKLNFVTAPIVKKVRDSEDIEQDEAGLFREHVDSSGAYSVVSAKSISLIKDCLIPVPKEKYRADDSRGSNIESISEDRQNNNLNLADYTIEGASSEEDHAAFLYSVASVDSAAFRTHRSLVHFRERKDDWTLKEIDEIDLAGFKSTIESGGYINSSNGVSKSRYYAKLPQVGTLKINSREEVKYFASRSMIMMHEDGSIHLQDGYGSTISMRAGSIDIACPGDITLRPGKNLVSIAGDSVSMISGTDIELSANLGDLRLQADRNVSVLAGNDGKGGVLIESKAVKSNVLSEDNETFIDPNTNSNSYGGIWFKAPGSSVCTISKEAYVGNKTDPCTIYFDSGNTSINFNGSQCIFATEQSVFCTDFDNPDRATNFLLNRSGLVLQTNGGFLLESNYFMASGRSSDINFYIDGAATFSKTMMAKSFAATSTQIAELQEDDLQEVVKSIQSSISDASDNVSAVVEGEKELYEIIDKSIVGKSNSTLKNLTFCYPDSNLRGIPDSIKYVLFQSDWQQQYKDQNLGEYLVFKGVDTNVQSGPTPEGVSNDKTYFWPGAKSLVEKFGKFNFNRRYVDDKLRFNKEGYDKPVSIVPEATSFQDNYVVISKNGLRIKE